jgi:hypothetical protein
MMHNPHSVNRKFSCKKPKARIERDFQENCFYLQVVNERHIQGPKITAWKREVTSELGVAVSHSKFP